MAIKKVYKSKTGSDYHITLMVDNSRVLVSLEGKEPTYTTTNEKIQKALEDNRYFKKGFIILDSQEETKSEIKESSIVVDTLPVGDPIEGAEKPVLKAKTEKVVEDNDSSSATAEKTEDNKVYTGVTSYLDARDILMETYGVSPQSVQKNPEAILKKATELGVSFPDLKTE